MIDTGHICCTNSFWRKIGFNFFEFVNSTPGPFGRSTLKAKTRTSNAERADVCGTWHSDQSADLRARGCIGSAVACQLGCCKRDVRPMEFRAAEIWYTLFMDGVR